MKCQLQKMLHIATFATGHRVLLVALALLPPLQMMEWLASEMAAADNPWLPEKEKHVVNVMCGLAQGILQSNNHRNLEINSSQRIRLNIANSIPL